MEKRIVAVLLILTVLLAAAPVLADEGFQITRIETQENGNVLVRWTDPSNNGPYIVAYQYISGGEALSLQVAAQDVVTKQYEIIDLAPGESYLILVIDSNLEYVSEEYSSQTQLFGGRGSTARLTVTLRQKRNNSVSTVDRFSASDIERTLYGGSDYYGATIKATMPQSYRRMEGVVRAAIKQPDGDMFVFMVQDESISSNTEYFWYDSVPFTQIWKYMTQQNDGEILTGVYTVSFYFNMDYFGYSDFVVAE